MQIFIHVMTSEMTSQEIWMFATGELGNQSNQIFCDLTRHMIYISEYKQTLVRFHLHSYENEKCYFSVVLFRPNFSCKFVNINFSIIFGKTMQAQINREKQLVEKINTNVHFRPKRSVTANIKRR